LQFLIFLYLQLEFYHLHFRVCLGDMYIGLRELCMRTNEDWLIVSSTHTGCSGFVTQIGLLK